MANVAQVAHLPDLPLEVEAVAGGHDLRVRMSFELAVGSLAMAGRAAGTLPGSGERARANGHRVVHTVSFQGKS